MGNNVRQFSSDKILKHIDRVHAWLRNENPYPITVELDMSNVCNHRCPECSGWNRDRPNKEMLSFEFALDIVRQLADAKIRGLIFTGGGEPLCSPYIKQTVLLASDLGLDIGFISNGSLFTIEIAEILLKRCIWLRISLDAATASTYEKIHGLNGKAFDSVIDNIRLLVELKRKLKSRTTLGIGYLTSTHTKDEMHQAAVLCRNLGVDYLQFRPMQIHSNGSTKYELLDLDNEIQRCMSLGTRKYKVLYSKHKYDMMKEKKLGRYYTKCYGQQFATVIAADGRMYVCCHMRGKDKYCLGDLHKSTFAEIWHSQRRKEIINNIDFRDCIPLCRDNTFNQVLWNIKKPREHVNFL